MSGITLNPKHVFNDIKWPSDLALYDGSPFYHLPENWRDDPFYNNTVTIGRDEKSDEMLIDMKFVALIRIPTEVIQDNEVSKDQSDKIVAIVMERFLMDLRELCPAMSAKILEGLQAMNLGTENPPTSAPDNTPQVGI